MASKKKEAAPIELDSIDEPPTTATTEPTAEIWTPPEAPSPAPEPPPAPPPASSDGKYRVWSHGSLQHDGQLYPEGSICVLPRALAAQLGEILTPVD